MGVLHNDYLRLLHLCGIHGLAMFLLFYVRLHLRVLLSLKLEASYQQDLFLNISLYSTFGVAVLMITDHPLSYNYTTVPTFMKNIPLTN